MAVRKNSTTKLLTTGVVVAFVSLSIFLFLLYSNLKTQKKPVEVKTGAAETEQDTMIDGNPSVWENYINEEYKYTISYPGLLIKYVKDTKGEYLNFVRFEENRYSEGQKGVAVGVSDKGIGEEAVKIKKEMTQSGLGELVSEEETSVMGQEAVRLDFEPTDPTLGEKRTVYIINKNGRSYSISTVPEQIDKIVASFKFLK